MLKTDSSYKDYRNKTTNTMCPEMRDDAYSKQFKQKEEQWILVDKIE